MLWLSLRICGYIRAGVVLFNVGDLVVKWLVRQTDHACPGLSPGWAHCGVCTMYIVSHHNTSTMHTIIVHVCFCRSFVKIKHETFWLHANTRTCNSLR